ncbi:MULTISPECIES: hypothetical protein [Comamonas]|uniref:hypothetical protein n=1 Tax=Comamonas TaxID=283 RepID=UPI0012D03FFB|nr:MULTISPECIES: hypothetical protein [Comamonas]MEB5966188.1 hypothetical protein [Comamonas testosteroni]MPS95186.1 hypothetical protein [Comamonas sp.]
MFISDEAFLNLAKPIKSVAHVGCSAGLGFISGIGCELIFGMGGFSLYRQKTEFKANQALAQSHQLPAAIKTAFAVSMRIRAGISPRLASYFRVHARK